MIKSVNGANLFTSHRLRVPIGTFEPPLYPQIRIRSNESQGGFPELQQSGTREVPVEWTR
jgi:hypothetical protein